MLGCSFKEFLKDNIPEKLLYIDCDTICIGDINGIKEYNDYPIYAVKDPMHQNYFQRFIYLDKYFNSGVLYIDTNKWNSINAEKRIIDFVNNNEQELSFPDQDILNCVCYHDIGELSLEYNYPPHPFLFNEREMQKYHKGRGTTVEETLEAKNSAKIYHSYGISGIKPWTKNSINPFNDIFMEYLLFINPNFKKESLSFLKSLYAQNRKLYCTLLLTKHFFSSKMYERKNKNLSKNNHKKITF